MGFINQLITGGPHLVSSFLDFSRGQLAGSCSVVHEFHSWTTRVGQGMSGLILSPQKKRPETAWFQQHLDIFFSVSKPIVPLFCSHQHSWVKMDVHPTKNGIYRYWPIPNILMVDPTGTTSWSTECVGRPVAFGDGSWDLGKSTIPICKLFANKETAWTYQCKLRCAPSGKRSSKSAVHKWAIRYMGKP